MWPPRRSAARTNTSTGSPPPTTTRSCAPNCSTAPGAFSSPTLTINGEYWDLKQLTLADTNMVDGFLKSIGLDADQVGVEGKMPSIGASGKPISVAS